MGYEYRKKKYEELKNIRKHPVVVYVTSTRYNMAAQMAVDAIPEIIEQIDNIPNKTKEIDFLIISNGGDPISALRIMSLLRERFSRVNVLLPYVAYSAATIFALGANKIVMHPYSNLGPIDPQMTISHNAAGGIKENINFSSEDLRNFIDFIRTDVGINDQKYLSDAIAPLLNDIGPLPIGAAKRSQQLSLSLSEKMLKFHISDNEKVKSIAYSLNSSFYHHGYAVGRTEAKNLGLPVEIPEKEIETLLWDIWKDFESEMQCNNPFDVVKEIVTGPLKDQLGVAKMIDFPANLPDKLKNDIMMRVAGEIGVSNANSFDMKLLVASIESNDMARAVYNNVVIEYWRNPDMSLGFNCNGFSSSWTDYEGV